MHMHMKAGENIDFHKSNNFMRSWSPQTGEICHAGIALSMNQSPPPVRDRPAMEVMPRKTAEFPDRKKLKEDPYVNTFLAAMKAAETVSGAVDGFQQWLNSPPPAPKEKTQAVKTVPPFGYSADSRGDAQDRRAGRGCVDAQVVCGRTELSAY